MKCLCGADATRTLQVSEYGSQSGVRVLTIVRQYCDRCADAIRMVAAEPFRWADKPVQRLTRRQ